MLGIDDLEKQIYYLDKNLIIKHNTRLIFSSLPEMQTNFKAYVKKSGIYIEQNGLKKQKNSLNLSVIHELFIKFNLAAKKDVSESPFYLSPGNSKFIEMLQCAGTFNYYSDEVLKAVELPIGFGNFNVLYILPETNEYFKRKNILSPYLINKIQNNFRKLNLNVYVPKLNSFDKYAVNQTNMQAIFKKSLNGIDLKKSVVLNDMVQKIQVQMGSDISKGNQQVINSAANFFIDRPFILLVTEKYTGAIIFIGKIENP